jgi:hypothetical protein
LHFQIFFLLHQPHLYRDLRLLLCFWDSNSSIRVEKVENGRGRIPTSTLASNIKIPAHIVAIHCRYLPCVPSTQPSLHIRMTITLPAFLVTIVYWILLSSSSTFATPYSGMNLSPILFLIFSFKITAWSNISKHALNSVFAAFEISLSNVEPLPWIDLPPTIAILAGYLGIAYITHATQGIYSRPYLTSPLVVVLTFLFSLLFPGPKERRKETRDLYSWHRDRPSCHLLYCCWGPSSPQALDQT